MNDNTRVLDFDMANFGFDAYKPMQRGYQTEYTGTNYLVFKDNTAARANGSKSPKYNMKFRLSEEASEFVNNFLTDAKGRIQLGMNENGEICIAKGCTTKVVKSNGSNKYSEISLSTQDFVEKVLSIFGDFRHIRYEMRVYGRCSALLFTPTAMRD